MPAFVDTNVVVYALGRDNDKQSKARHILEATPIASSQVMNETIAVLTGKQRCTREEACEVVEALMKLVAVAPVTATTVRDATARVKVVVASVMQPTVEYGYPPNASLLWSRARD